MISMLSSFILRLMRPVVIVMVKVPSAGFAKTRLTPPLSEVNAASLASCFVQDVINSALRIVPNLVVSFSPGDGRTLLEALLPPNLHWLEQPGGDLGERLDAAITYAANLGYEPIIVMGADSPTLPDSLIETARDALATEKADAVLGPTVDGGYYLLGLRNCVPHLFQNIDWSTPLTYEQTASNITVGDCTCLSFQGGTMLTRSLTSCACEKNFFQMPTRVVERPRLTAGCSIMTCRDFAMICFAKHRLETISQAKAA